MRSCLAGEGGLDLRIRLAFQAGLFYAEPLFCSMDKDDWQTFLNQDPGNPYFAEVAEDLRKQGQAPQAFRVCFSGLSANPHCHLGRLVLARLFYEQGSLPFALRELKTLAEELPDNKYIAKLLGKLTPGEISQPTEQPGESTIAEAEFDFDDIDLLEEEEGSKTG